MREKVSIPAATPVQEQTQLANQLQNSLGQTPPAVTNSPKPPAMKGSSWLPGAVYRARLADQKWKKGGKGKSKGNMKGKKGKKSK